MRIGRFVLIVAGLVLDTLNVSGEPKPNVPPRFQDYPVKEMFGGKPVPPSIVTPEQRRYRTRIREGVRKGWGVRRNGLEQSKPGPNFAGDMIVIQWGCGAPCLMAALVNARTGEVYDPPLAVDQTLELPLLSIGCCSASRNPDLEFRQNSRLMIVSASPNWFRKNHRSYRHYFVWQLNRWTLVYKESLD
jgi:hypothetical protein